jgi:hypothetical protein
MKSPTRGGVAVGLPGVGGGGPVGVPGGGAWWHARLYGPEGGYPSQPGTYAANHRLNMEVDLRSLFGLHVT